MNDFAINVTEVEELQMTNSIADLEQIFSKAKSLIVLGDVVVLVRKNADGSTYKFDELTTESDVENYKQTVFKYLQ
jgi:uncharacterized linocin/CFP29 family protein